MPTPLFVTDGFPPRLRFGLVLGNPRLPGMPTQAWDMAPQYSTWHPSTKNIYRSRLSIAVPMVSMAQRAVIPSNTQPNGPMLLTA
jgi:hypothetical protein